MPFPLSVPISVTIIAKDEEASIGRTLQSVAWADDIVVVDSGSRDKTREIAREMGARVIENPWPGYGQQKNFAQKAARHDWVLNLDADEVLSPELTLEIQELLEELQAGEVRSSGFALARKTFYLGRWIRHGGWYPNFLVRLADRRRSRWSEPAVHEELVVDGEVSRLKAPIEHYAFQSIGDQVLTNLRFSTLGTDDLRRQGRRPSLPLLVLKPLGKFLETFFLKRGFLDGIAGFIISVNAAHSIFLKYANLFEEHIREADH